MTIEKDLLIFKTHFQCKCQSNTARFIKKQINPAMMELLCPYCERRFRISINYEEIE